jgi:hypothetical protein
VFGEQFQSFIHVRQRQAAQNVSMETDEKIVIVVLSSQTQASDVAKMTFHGPAIKTRSYLCSGANVL